MAKKVETKPAIVVSANRPKIQIRHAGWFVRVTIPAYTRRTLAIAHVVTGALYAEITDGQWDQLELVIGAGDHARTCTTIDISIMRELRATIEASARASGWRDQTDSIMRTKLDFLIRPLRDAVSRATTPLYGGDRAYDIVETYDDLKDPSPKPKDV